MKSNSIIGLGKKTPLYEEIKNLPISEFTQIYLIFRYI